MEDYDVQWMDTLEQELWQVQEITNLEARNDRGWISLELEYFLTIFTTVRGIGFNQEDISQHLGLHAANPRCSENICASRSSWGLLDSNMSPWLSIKTHAIAMIVTLVTPLEYCTPVSQPGHREMTRNLSQRQI
jgi:hypothetical protein